MPAARPWRSIMEVLYPSCTGLDVHKDTVVACRRRVIGGEVMRKARAFKTTRPQAFLTNSDFRLIAPMPSILQSMS
jgi:hypothetical protein